MTYETNLLQNSESDTMSRYKRTRTKIQLLLLLGSILICTLDVERVWLESSAVVSVDAV